MKAKILGLLAVGLLTGPITASATSMTWYLQNVSFANGGNATGSFGYDAATAAYSNIAVTTTAGSVLAGASYSLVLGSAADLVNLYSASPSVDGSTYVFQLNLVSLMTAAGGTINLVNSYEGICASSCSSLSP